MYAEPNPVPARTGAVHVVRSVAVRWWCAVRPFPPSRFDLLNLAILAVLVLALFSNSLLRGQVYAQSDTTDFYYPFLVEYDRAVSQGGAPLWVSQIYGGYPLYADGETGIFSPINFLTISFLNAFDALVVARILRGIVAAWGAYALGRAIGLTRLGALVSGTVFALGSFHVVQVHHMNVVNTAVWLPWVLFFVERAVQASGLRRHAGALGAGVMLGVAALGLHVQVLLMVLLAVGMYLPFRCYWGPVGGAAAPSMQSAVTPALLARNIAGRTALLVYLSVVTFGVAGCLAAVQMLPLWELSRVAVRGTNLGYGFASSYSLTPHNFVGLLFPYFFRGDDRIWWSLWSEWETTLYIGIAPLMLALFAVVRVRSRYTVFFGLLAVLSLAVSLGSYAPFDLHRRLWELPGFSLMRAPGRMTFLAVFGGALLAGLGADWLDRRMRARVGSQAERAAPFRRRSVALGVVAGSLALPLALVLTMTAGYAWVNANRDAVLGWFASSYFSQPHIRLGMPAAQGYDGLLWALNLSNLRTLLTLGLFAATGALAAATLLIPAWRVAWRPALVLLIAGDLIVFGTGFHTTLTREQLESSNKYVTFLREMGGEARAWGDASGRTAPPNRTMTSDVTIINGYSSLTPFRQQHFLNQLFTANDALLDSASVRYLVRPIRPTAPSEYQGVAYHPRQPLLQGSANSGNAQAIYRLHGRRVDRIKVIGMTENAATLPPGAPVLEFTLTGAEGQQQTLTARVGEHIADAALDTGEQRSGTPRRPLAVAFSIDVQTAGGGVYRGTVSYGELPLAKPVVATRLAVRTIAPEGRARVFGIAVADGETGQSWQVAPDDSEDLQLVYTGEEARIYERRTALPRAYFTSVIEPAPVDRRLVERMSAGSFDPHTRTIVEELQTETPMPSDLLVSATVAGAEGGAQLSSAAPSSAVLRADIHEYEPTKVTVQVDAPLAGYVVLTDSYYPGWRAIVDGVEAPIYQANYLFRAVPVPAGKHDVRFVFRPEPALAGAHVALMISGVILLYFGGAALVPFLRRRAQ